MNKMRITCFSLFLVFSYIVTGQTINKKNTVQKQCSTHIEVKSLCSSGIGLEISYPKKLRFTQDESDLHLMYPAGCASFLCRDSFKDGCIGFSVVDSSTITAQPDCDTITGVSGFKAVTCMTNIPKVGFMETSIFCGDRIVKLIYEEKQRGFVKEVLDRMKISLN